MFFCYEGIFKIHWVSILRACLAFNSVISQSVLQAFLQCFFQLNPMKSIIISIQAENKSLELKTKLIQSSLAVISLDV